jgi:hypothetical protein
MRILVGSLAILLAAGAVLTPRTVTAASDADKAALQKATADCTAQVKQYAQYNNTSWYQRRKMRKSCINDALAKK